MDGVVVIIKKDDKYLMLQQSKTKPFPLKWLPVSGGVERDESLEAAALRETKEEVGLEIKIIAEVAILPADYKVKQIYFFTALWQSGEVKIDSKEINDYKWVSGEEIMKLDLMNSAKIFFQKYFKPF